MSPLEVNPYLERSRTSSIQEKETVSQIVRRPEVKLGELLEIPGIRKERYVQTLLDQTDKKLSREILEQIEIEIKYDGYIAHQQIQIEKFERFESMTIPEDYDYNQIRALSTEGKEKLTRTRPGSIGQASRISGVTPADISVLMVHLRR